MAAATEEEEYDVTLYVYDLSNGLVKQLSKAFVGREFEGMWHTGVVIFGKEFYWAGDIQCSTAGRTQYGRPVKVIPLGKTHVPKALIYEYVESVRPEYNVNTYSLFSKNCNNFSNDFTTFLTGHGIPEDILNLPQEVLSTPLGAAIRPFIESMEQKSRQQNQSSIFYPPGYGVAPSQMAYPTPVAQQPSGAQSQIPYTAPIVQQPQSQPVEQKKEIKLKERTDGIIKKDGTAMVSAQGDAKSFIEKLSKSNKIPQEIINALDTLLCTPTGKESIPNNVFEFFETSFENWKFAECAALLFIFRKLVMHPSFGQHYLSKPDGPRTFGKLLGRFVGAPFPEQKAVVALGLAAASNVFATEKGAELMLKPDVCTLAFVPAMDKVGVQDVSVRLMALGLAYNYSRFALSKEVGEKCVERLANVVTECFDEETGAEDAEYRALLALGYLLYNNPLLGSLLKENDELIAVVISYQSSENEKIAKVAKELSDIMDEINEKL